MNLLSEFNHFKKPQLFEKLSEESQKRILECSVLKKYEKNRLLVQQGDTPKFVYLVMSGSLKTFRINDEGGEATIRMLEPGDTCMEAVMFMGGPSPINVQTLTESETLLIPERIIKTLVFEDTQFSVNLLRIVTRHYKNAMHQIDAMNIKSPLQRIGYYFLLKHIEQGNESLEFKLPFKKQMVANYLGMTPETFSRSLKQMRSMGVTVEEDKISLKDARSLCLFCDSDTAALCADHNKEDCQFCLLH
ncbi:MAG: cyclic nucleotide-binding domain-containing protein [Alphaproteobacteria bacterium]|nr:cyclic nucleotide-binding domain-containing protein [Alphaproteobacteria bacterium]HRW29559.1 cyclic nucleotide-binding domain-containing protein [Emcibacteraceae bacterium]